MDFLDLPSIHNSSLNIYRDSKHQSVSRNPYDYSSIYWVAFGRTVNEIQRYVMLYSCMSPATDGLTICDLPKKVLYVKQADSAFTVGVQESSVQTRI